LLYFLLSYSTSFFKPIGDETIIVPIVWQKKTMKTQLQITTEVPKVRNHEILDAQRLSSYFPVAKGKS